jgi:hypothetical protein
MIKIGTRGGPNGAHVVPDIAFCGLEILRFQAEGLGLLSPRLRSSQSVDSLRFAGNNRRTESYHEKGVVAHERALPAVTCRPAPQATGTAW